jgi:glycosyltransferase involved in cell wall biosynthesis
VNLLLDLQGAQSQSRHRGIGRYTLALSRAFLAHAAPSHDVRLLLNARFDTPTDALIATLGRHASSERRILLDVPEGIRAQPGGNLWLRRAAARTMRHAIENLDADVVWYSSVLEGYNDDAVLPDAPPAGVATVATLYDLIPLHDPDAYLGHPRVRQWYEQSVETLRRCDLLLAISEWVRKDAIERLGILPERVVNIGAAVDESFRAPEPGAVAVASEALRRRHGIVRPFVLYSGGFDSRKNVAALIEAFAALPDELRANHQLVIVGRGESEEMARLRACERVLKLPAGTVVYTGFASDDDLKRLYAECALFVFPSLLEGFGLTPLEAMACGAPVIASNAASLPEVIDRHDLLFDPTRVGSIAEKMASVLGNPALSAELREYARTRTASFSWEAVATRALDALQALMKERSTRNIASHSSEPRISCVLADRTQPPAWLGKLGARADAVSQTHLHHMVSPAKRHADCILYVATADTASSLEPAMRMHPGVLLILDTTSKTSPDIDDKALYATYVASGYSGLLASSNRSATQTDAALIPLLQHAIGVLCTDAQLPDRLHSQAPAMSLPDMTVLPAHQTFEACLQHVQNYSNTSALARETRLLDDIVSMKGKPGDNDLAAIANAVVSARNPREVRQWLIDVSSIAEKDIRTGVQRVVRNILMHWLASAPKGIRIEPVRFSNGRYRYARRYTLDLLGLKNASLADDAVEAARGDVFVGLDWNVDAIAPAEPQLRDWHRRGVSLHFLLHDLLPLTLPDMFHPYARGRFEDWLRRIASIADQLVCVSRATAGDLRAWMASATLDYQFGAAPIVSDSPLGADATLGTGSASVPRKPLADAMQQRPTLLMVGTIEPRKGYDQALDACEMLWNEGADFNLVIVGHFGWLMETLRTRLEAHARRHQHLFWIDDAGDDELDAIYRSSTSLLAASWGEGYGLPLIEAARRGLPVIARDLPVFREVMGARAQYFIAPDTAELANVLRQWLAAPGSHRAEIAPSWPSWAQSAARMADTIAAFHPT